MEKPKPYVSKKAGIPAGHHPNEVYVLRDWKEYIGESLLIIFSVLLALGLTETINYFHEKSETREMVENIKKEIIKNKHNTELQYAYQTHILARIDSALKDKSFQQKLVNNDRFHYELIAPDGILCRELDDAAWQVAKNHNLMSRVKFSTVEMLTDIYDDQMRIAKLEDEVARVLLTRESRNPAYTHVTLTLIRDNYKGWAYDRTPNLLKNYNKAIKQLSDDY